jgi:hypothetical protein
VGLEIPTPPLISNMLKIHNKWKIFLEGKVSEKKIKASFETKL